MPAATCPSAEELQAYAVGRLPDETSEHVADHLDGCAECQAAIATMDDAEDTFVTALRRYPEQDGIVEESECEAAVQRAAHLDSARPAMPSQDAQTTLTRVGEQLGEYRLLEEIGRGGMGRVYRALQTKLDRVVALKVLPMHRSDDRRAIARFEREMKAIGRLDHPNIVHAYDAREIDGKPVLAMEFVEGRDLACVLLNLGTVETAEACELIRQAAIGLQYAHENGLIHRDIKPSNIMLTPEGNVKLLDLGLARFEQPTTGGEEMTGIGQPMGTADYMAPEQVSDSRAADIRADIYSLGCTLFKLLTGHAPFSGPECRGTFDKLSAHVNDPAPSILEYYPHLPAELAKLIDQMLAKSPAERPATPADVAAALEPHCAGSDLPSLESRAAEAEQRRHASEDGYAALPVDLAPPKKPHTAVQTAGSRSWLWSAITALVLLAGAGGFALGVIITIERNGKKTSVEVPDGSAVAIDHNANVKVKLPNGETVNPSTLQGDAEAIQGVWKIVDRKGKSWKRSLLRAGREVTADGTYLEKWRSSRIEFRDGRMRVLGEYELPASHEFQINPAESPKMIDAFVANDELLGVYELAGGKLKICFDWSGHSSNKVPNIRPQAVWAGLHSDQEMLVLERVGPATESRDENKMLGSWVVESASLQTTTDILSYRVYATPVGKIERGRPVIITPSEFIIKAAPDEVVQSDTSWSDVKKSPFYSDGRPQWLQPSARDEHFTYTLDAPRSWISFSATYEQPSRGIYSFSDDTLVIRLGGSERPEQIDHPWAEGETVLLLRRKRSVTTGSSKPPQQRVPEVDKPDGPEDAQPEQPKKARRANPQTILMIDALGCVTTFDGLRWQHLGTSADDYAILLKKQISENKTTYFDIHVDPKAPKGVLTAVLKALENTGVQGTNVKSMRVPLAPIQLDFRIAANRHSDELPGLTDEEVEKLIAMKKDPAGAKEAEELAKQYTWVEIEGEAYESLAQNEINMITLSLNKPYLLVHQQADKTMLHSDKDERAWKILKAESVIDSVGKPAVSLELDDAGGKRIEALSGENLRRTMALVINSKVIMAPRIQTTIGSKLRITGNFEKDEVDILVRAFNGSQLHPMER